MNTETKAETKAVAVLTEDHNRQLARVANDLYSPKLRAFIESGLKDGVEPKLTIRAAGCRMVVSGFTSCGSLREMIETGTATLTLKNGEGEKTVSGSLKYETDEQKASLLARFDAVQ